MIQAPKAKSEPVSGARFAGRSLSCVRGGRQIFAGLDFTLAPSEALMMTGPNGAGKTTALRLMAGLLEPSGGSIHWGDADIGDDRAAHARRVCLIGHADALKTAWTLSQNLQFWARFAGADQPERRTEAALDRLGLGALAGVPVSNLSRGQARRGSLARLLLANRPLWLLDEPTASLDEASSALIAELVEEHRTSGGRAAIATHIPIGVADASTLDFSQFAGGRAA